MHDFDFKNPDYLAVYKKRARLLNKIREDDTGQAFAILVRHYRNNPAAFINDWAFTFDPRNADLGLPTSIPFILFDRQKQWLEWARNSWLDQKGGTTVKSRDMGVSWLACAFAVWMWLFNQGTVIGFGSRKEEYVDKKGDPKSLFWKIRFMLSKMPKEFLPAGYNEDKHAPFMRIINPENGSAIIGEAGDNIGRGNRATIYFVDEAAHIERPKLVDASLSQTTNCRIDIGTPNGTGNPFYQKFNKKNANKFIFHWKEDPRKDKEWYAKQVENLPSFVVAQEIDIDFMASVEGAVIPAKYLRACVNFLKEASGQRRGGLDVADEEGKDSNSFAYGQGVRIEGVEEWNGIDTTITARKAWALGKRYNLEVINYDSIGVGAGVRGEFNSLLREDNSYRPKINAVNTAPPPERGMLIQGKQDKDMFASKKALYWWQFRLRAERTYQHVNGIKEYPIDELCSLPDDPDLISELSQATYTTNTAGKIVINKIGEGTKSPNKADSAILFFVPPKIVRVR